MPGRVKVGSGVGLCISTFFPPLLFLVPATLVAACTPGCILSESLLWLRVHPGIFCEPIREAMSVSAVHTSRPCVDELPPFDT